jgi:hypothetical protein
MAMRAICFILFLALFLPALHLHSGPIMRAEIGITPDREVYFTDMTVGYRFMIWRVESLTLAGARTWSIYSPYFTGHPFEDIYFYEQRATYKNVFLKFKHHCAHRIISHHPTPDWWEGDITTLSAGVEYEFR